MPFTGSSSVHIMLHLEEFRALCTHIVLVI